MSSNALEMDAISGVVFFNIVFVSIPHPEPFKWNRKDYTCKII